MRNSNRGEKLKKAGSSMEGMARLGERDPGLTDEEGGCWCGPSQKEKDC